jgi:nucleotide-binding universal stress UspA family protein
MMSFRKILIAVDSEPVAARAADIGVELARALGAEVALIHVIDTSLVLGGDTGIPPNELIARAEQEGQRLVAGFRQRLSLPTTALEFVLSGSPASEIVKAAKEWTADLIVIGSHGRGGIQRALLGSVAEWVMRHAPCPVLIIRAKE